MMVVMMMKRMSLIVSRLDDDVEMDADEDGWGRRMAREEDESANEEDGGDDDDADHDEDGLEDLGRHLRMASMEDRHG